MACIWLLSSWDQIFLPYALILINFHNQKLEKYERHKVHEEEYVLMKEKQHLALQSAGFFLQKFHLITVYSKC